MDLGITVHNLKGDNSLQLVLELNIIRVFVSYSSQIADWDVLNGVLTLSEKWEYSKTTMKYFKRFINEFTPFTYTTAQEWRNYLEANATYITSSEIGKSKIKLHWEKNND